MNMWNTCVGKNAPFLSIMVSDEWVTDGGLEGLIFLEAITDKTHSLVSFEVWSMMAVFWWLGSQQIHAYNMTTSILLKSS